MEKSQKSRRAQFWLGITISLISLAAILIAVEPSDILDAIQQVRYDRWFLALLALVIFMVFRAVRWQFMLNAGSRRNGEVAYGTVFHIQNIGYFLTYILPFRLGDVARAVLIGNVSQMTISRGLSTMVAERVLDLLFMVILFPITVLALGKLPPEINAAVRLATVAAIVAAFILIIAANQRSTAVRVAGRIFDRISFLDSASWSGRVNDLLLGLDVFTRFADAMKLVLLSVLVWLPIVAGYYVGLHGVNLDVSLLESAFVVCISAFALSIPSTPGGLGPQEAGIAFAISTFLGLSEAAAVTFAILYRLINYIVLGVLAVIGILYTGETFGSVISSTREFVKRQSI